MIMSNGVFLKRAPTVDTLYTLHTPTPQHNLVACCGYLYLIRLYDGKNLIYNLAYSNTGICICICTHIIDDISYTRALHSSSSALT
jgi:hypothetical protein